MSHDGLVKLKNRSHGERECTDKENFSLSDQAAMDPSRKEHQHTSGSSWQQLLRERAGFFDGGESSKSSASHHLTDALAESQTDEDLEYPNIGFFD